ncbi:MAG: O-methyltransferase [Erysipelotrichaceae bacterium]
MIEYIKQKAKSNRVPIIKDGGLLYLEDLIKKNNVKSILELGTAVGYSAIAMASLSDDIYIDTIEKNEDMYHEALANIEAEGLDERINVIYMPIENYKTDKKYDLIFVDAAKAQYPKYLEQFLGNLKNDGVMFFDNMVFHGMIYHPENIKNRSTRALVRKIVNFRKSVSNDNRFDIIFEDNVGDGLLILRRRKAVESKQEALLGFVEAARSYLDKHMDEEIQGLNFEDMSILHDELKGSQEYFDSDNLEKGHRAFEDYLKENINPNKRNVLDELGEIFDVEFFKDDEVRNVSKDKKEYVDDLENIFLGIDEDNDIFKAINESASINSDMPVMPSYNGVPDGLDDIYKDVIEHEDMQLFDDDIIEETDDKYEISDNSINIYEAVQETRPVVLNPGIFNVLDNDGKKNLVHEKIEDGNVIEPADSLLDILNNDMPITSIVYTEEEENEDVYEEPSYHFFLNPCFDVKEEKEEDEFVTELPEKKEEVMDEPVFEIEEKPAVEDEINPFESYDYMYHVIENPGLDVVFKNDMATKPEKEVYEQIQNLRTDENEEEIKRQFVKPEEDTIEETVQDEPEDVVEEAKSEILEDKKSSYVDTLLSELDEELEKEINKRKVSGHDDIYHAIAELYPFLSMAFIKSAYNLKEEIVNSYPDGLKLILLHRVNFREVEYLRKFCEIMLNHDYQINADEKKMIVDTFKMHTNEDGLILNDIFSVANQARLLCGDYEGYRVLTKEDF